MHDWCIGAIGFGMGRCGLLAIGPDDYIGESILWGKRQDGYILNSPDLLRCRIHEADFLSQITAQIEPIENGSPGHSAFTQFNAATAAPGVVGPGPACLVVENAEPSTRRAVP